MGREGELWQKWSRTGDLDLICRIKEVDDCGLPKLFTFPFINRESRDERKKRSGKHIITTKDQDKGKMWCNIFWTLVHGIQLMLRSRLQQFSFFKKLIINKYNIPRKILLKLNRPESNS